MVRDAVNLLMRLKLGQLEEIWQVFSRSPSPLPEGDERWKRREQIEDLCYQLKMALGFPMEHGRHGSYGVGSSALTPNDNRLYEMYKVLDHALWRLGNESNPDDSFCVCAGDPYLLNFSGDKKIPVTIRKNKKTIKLHKSK